MKIADFASSFFKKREVDKVFVLTEYGAMYLYNDTIKFNKKMI